MRKGQNLILPTLDGHFKKGILPLSGGVSWNKENIASIVASSNSK